MLRSPEIPLAAAERRVREAGVPVLLWESWLEGFDAPGAPPRLPSMPRGRDPRLGEALDGIVALGGEAALPVVESAWDAAAAGLPDPVETALAGIPVGTVDPVATIALCGQGLLDAHARAGGMLPWLEPVARDLLGRATRLPKDATWLVPTVPDPVTLDGAVDERAWAWGTPIGHEGKRFLLVTDGRTLHVAFRGPGSRVAWSARVTVHDDVGGTTRVLLRPGQQRVLAYVGSEHVVVRGRVTEDSSAFEVAFDRFALGGDPHPGRVLGFAARYVEDDRPDAGSPATSDAEGWPLPDGALVLGR
jgi:hypothetical protein